MSFAASLRRAVEAAPRVKLGELSAGIWKAWGSGSLSDDEAQALSDLVAARKALPAPEKPVQRRVGSRPRSPASMERRRSWVASGHLPPQLAARFTLGEAAVLSVIAVEVRRHGRCTLTIPHIAALAGVGRSTVKRALSEAHALGVIRIQERRLTAFRNDSNVVSVVDPAWSAWLRLRRAGLGSISRPAAQYKKEQGAPIGAKGYRGKGAGGWSVAQSPYDGHTRPS
jgi:hypothetical protein